MKLILVLSLIIFSSIAYAWDDDLTDDEYNLQRSINDMIAIPNATVVHYGIEETLRESGYDPFVEVEYDNGYVARNCEQIMEGDIVCY